MTRTSTIDAARGRWKGILPMFGVPVAHLDGRQHPCPSCEGKDRWRFDDRDGSGSSICNQCGSAITGIELIRKLKGWDFATAAAEVDKIVGAVPAAPVRVRDFNKEREWCNRLWKGAKPITQGDAAGQWLFRRCGLTEYPACLRFHSALRWRPEGEAPPEARPGMVALVTAPDGKPTILHRTILGTGLVSAPRIIMPGHVAKGSAVRLMPMDGEIGGVSEGIETAFSASVLEGIPVWAALNATLLEQWEPPAHLRRIVVFADADVNFRGQAAAYRLANRLMARKDPPIVEVREPLRAPPVLGLDFNDAWAKAHREREIEAA